MDNPEILSKPDICYPNRTSQTLIFSHALYGGCAFFGEARSGLVKKPLADLRESIPSPV
jgi:hypothetical protein